MHYSQTTKQTCYDVNKKEFLCKMTLTLKWKQDHSFHIRICKQTRIHPHFLTYRIIYSLNYRFVDRLFINKNTEGHQKENKRIRNSNTLKSLKT